VISSAIVVSASIESPFRSRGMLRATLSVRGVTDR